VFPIQQTVRLALADGALPEGAPPAIVSSEEGGEFRALAAPALRDGAALRLGKEARERLGVVAGDEVTLTPMPRSSARAGDGG